MSYISDFEGIIGAVLGVIVTLVTTHLLRFYGQVNIEINDVSVHYFKKDEYNENIHCDEEEAEDIKIIFDVYFYNNSDVPKSLKCLSIQFCNSKKEKLYGTTLHDIKSDDELEIMNFQPKILTSMKAKTTFPYGEEQNYTNCKYIFICYKDHKGKDGKKLLTELTH